MVQRQISAEIVTRLFYFLNERIEVISEHESDQEEDGEEDVDEVRIEENSISEHSVVSLYFLKLLLLF